MVFANQLGTDRAPSVHAIRAEFQVGQLPGRSDCRLLAVGVTRRKASLCEQSADSRSFELHECNSPAVGFG